MQVNTPPISPPTQTPKKNLFPPSFPSLTSAAIPLPPPSSPNLQPLALHLSLSTDRPNVCTYTHTHAVGRDHRHSYTHSNYFHWIAYPASVVQYNYDTLFLWKGPKDRE